LANGGQSVVGSERLITKIYFPRLAIPLASVGAALVDFVVALTVFFGLIMFYGIGLTWNLFLVVPVFVGVFLATSGMAIFLGALNVIYRDVRYVIPFLVQVWMFATPTIYMDPSGFEALEKTGWNWLLWANPMTGLVACFRAATLGGSIPWLMFFSGLVISVVLFIAGCLYFRKLEDQFADVI
jgi:lipopolysaccharide transport system permease protein